MSSLVLATAIPGLKRFATGKVRDVYDLGDTLLIVATDRLSAFDVVMANGIPEKGRVLTQLSRYWFQRLRPLTATHYISCDAELIETRLREAGAAVTPELMASLCGRSMLGVRAKAFPVECVVRGYLAGSLWQEYQKAGGQARDVTLHGIALPAGLRESERLPAPIFTPATKPETGHDENISTEQAGRILGDDVAAELARLSVSLYSAAAEAALSRGIIIADTKFEFGMHGGALTLIDEALTPDSSRFWEQASYEPGRTQASYDKQFVRDWLVESGWNREPPGPELPEDVVRRTSEKYLAAYARLAGRPLPEG